MQGCTKRTRQRTVPMSTISTAMMRGEVDRAVRPAAAYSQVQHSPGTPTGVTRQWEAQLLLPLTTGREPLHHGRATTLASTSLPQVADQRQPLSRDGDLRSLLVAALHLCRPVLATLPPLSVTWSVVAYPPAGSQVQAPQPSVPAWPYPTWPPASRLTPVEPPSKTRPPQSVTPHRDCRGTQQPSTSAQRSQN